MAEKKNNVVVAGGGVFGTAIAERLAWNDKNNVIIHSVESDVVKTINEQHRNVKYFPTRYLNMNLKASGDYSVFCDADQIFLVIPSKAIVSFSQEIKKYTKDREPLVINLAKGMSDDGAFITEKIPFRNTASMKGPSFAIEVLNGLPTAFTFGGKKEDYLFVKDCHLAFAKHAFVLAVDKTGKSYIRVHFFAVHYVFRAQLCGKRSFLYGKAEFIANHTKIPARVLDFICVFPHGQSVRLDPLSACRDIYLQKSQLVCRYIVRNDRCLGQSVSV